MLTSCARVNVFGERCKAAKQGFWLRFNHSWDPRVVPIRNFQTVSEGVFSETQLPVSTNSRKPSLCLKQTPIGNVLLITATSGKEEESRCREDHRPMRS